MIRSGSNLDKIAETTVRHLSKYCPGKLRVQIVKELEGGNASARSAREGRASGTTRLVSHLALLSRSS